MSYLTVPPEYLEYLPDLQKSVNLFITFTPMFSYGTTCYGIWKNKSSVGFSIDICGTMLMASILRIFYYFVTPYEISLLRQSIVMVVSQFLLLKVSLYYRPANYSTDNLQPYPSIFSELQNYKNNLGYLNNNLSNMSLLSILLNYLNFGHIFITIIFKNVLNFFDVFYKRPGCFWQWLDEKEYWKFILKFTMIFGILTSIFHTNQFYGSCIGTLGLFIESLLPLPQILLLNRLKSIKNFKVILLLTWLSGDCTKITYLVYGTDNVSFIFIFAALFQMSLDFFIGFQYFYFRNLERVDDFNLNDEYKP